MPINTVDLISSAFEDASFAAISTACERWAQAEGITLIAHDWRGSQSAPEEACDGRRPVVLHVPHGFRRFDGGLRDFRLHPSSVRVFERPVAEPWRIEGFGDLHLIHGRGLKSFKWALRMLAKSTASPVLHLRYGRHPDQGGPDTATYPVRRAARPSDRHSLARRFLERRRVGRSHGTVGS